MPVLHLDDVPSEVYERLKKPAATRDRTLEVEALNLLQQGLAQEIPCWQISAAGGFTPPAGTPDGADMLRANRQR